MKNIKLNLKSKITNAKSKGFSLVELLVVITIIAILSVVAYTAVGGQTIKAKNSRRMQDLSTIQSGLEAYFIQNSEYPATVLVASPTPNTHTHYYTFNTTQLGQKYLSKTPLDPWSDDGKPVPYAYSVDTAKKKYQLATVLEDAEIASKAYVVGNGTALIKSKTATIVTDGGANLPYEKPSS